MNQNLKLLADTLRSGEYKQTSSVLSTNGMHCCLGVACELYMKQVGDLVKENRANEECYRYDSEAHCLPLKVSNWLNIGTVEARISVTEKVIEILTAAKYQGPIPILGSWTYLTVLNDNGLSFDNIADIIESGAVLELNDTPTLV